ncbi:MAG: hypothetical protein IT186_06925 [Acidobacteria bacterium]|nr:hypothetical protein [Acidobacteriota bacterium]MCK6685772.1 hypothetical protein [Thermoanaerobaculia bacterium]
MTAKTWILILVLAAVQTLLLAPHRHAVGLEEQACFACQTSRAATIDIPPAPSLAEPRFQPQAVEDRHAPEVTLLCPVLERGNPRSPPAA